MTLISRPGYIETLRAWQEHTDLIKIITGIRRCGKSVLFSLFQDDLRARGCRDTQIQHFNFEMDENEEFFDLKKLRKHILGNLVKNKMNYVFLDEVQLLPDWPRMVNNLRLHKNIDVYITGSNANMFSSELATQIGGRYIEIRMQPLSFREYLSGVGAKQAHDLQAVYEHYTRESGFPQTVAFKGNRQLINDYLMHTVYQNTIQKDIVERFKLKGSTRLDNIIRYMFSNIGCEISLRGIERSLKAAGRGVSPTTVDIYIQGLLDSYLLYKCSRYDLKGKKILESNAKYYVADIGLRTALLGRPDTDLGYALENIIYLELLRRGYRVSVGKVTTKTLRCDGKSASKVIEVDFIASTAEERVEYYQVALTALDPETLRRELAPLEEIKDNFPKYLLTLDYGHGVTNGIHRVNALQWLAGKL